MRGLGDLRNDEATGKWAYVIRYHPRFQRVGLAPTLVPVVNNEQAPVRRSPRRAPIRSSRLDMDDEKRQQDDWASSRKNRLPSFTEVLSRRTRPPVDLFMF